MKKLLGILITIAGGGMSGIIANKPYSTQIENNNLEKSSRIKRDDRSNNNDIDYQFDLFGTSWLYLSITENFWNLIGESIVFYAKQNYNLDDFKTNFANNIVPNKVAFSFLRYCLWRSKTIS